MDILWWAGHVVGMVDGVDNLRPDEENETPGSTVAVVNLNPHLFRPKCLYPTKPKISKNKLPILPTI